MLNLARTFGTFAVFLGFAWIVLTGGVVIGALAYVIVGTGDPSGALFTAFVASLFGSTFTIMSGAFVSAWCEREMKR